MSAYDDIFSQIPMDQLAARLGVDPSTAEQATRQALPALLGGLEANAQDPQGAASLASAAEQHDPSLIEGGVDVTQVDPADGEKIVGHVFGAQQDQVMQQLGGLGGGGGSGLVQKLLPMLAPIVMSYLAKQLGGRASASGAAAGGGSDPLGSVLGGILGGAGGSGGLGDLLGGLLGGGRR